MIRLSLSSIVVSFSIFLSAISHAQENNQYLIEKLEKVYLSLAPNDPSKVPVTLRLADLLADRARLDSMKELNEGCVQCKAGTADRTKALQLYKEVQAKAPAASQAKIMIQMGHLQELMGQEAQAVESYAKVIQGTQEGPTQAEAYLSIAEIHYKKARWSDAQKNYEAVLKINGAASKGFASYRRAWSLYNQGQIASAKAGLIEILSTPALLSRSGSSQSQVDVSFQDEVAADFATFSGRDFAFSDLEKMMSLAPASTRLKHVESIAAELERTGKKADALKAWDFAFQRQSAPELRMGIQSHMAVLSLETGLKSEALTHYQGVYSVAPGFKTTAPSEYEESKRVLKASIITWNQAEKKAPSVELLSIYEGYLTAYGFEKEMNQWAVQLARDLKQWDRAWALQKQAVAALVGADLENQLLLGIELAEAAQDKKMLAEAQDLYLAKAPLRKQEWAVKYQKAYAIYESEDGAAKALPMMKAIALNVSTPADLRVKAADLTLDILALQKNDAELEQTAKEFTQVIKNGSSDWSVIAQKAVLNQVAATATTSADVAWAKLLSFDMKKADDASKIVYLKNKMAMAEKRGDLTAALLAAQELAAATYASPEDHTFAVTQVARYMDLKMDFKGAMAATRMVPEKVLAADQKALKLALYAELTGESSAPYLTQFIQNTKDETEKVMAAAELVRKSAKFEADLQKQFNVLLKKPEVLANLILDQYVTKQDIKWAQMIEKQAALKETVAGKMILKDQLLKSIAALGDKLTASQMDGATQKSVVKSIKERAALLEQMEKLAAAAISSKDWTAQVMTLSYLGKESQRFYEEILSLPLPEGLSEAEQGEYMNLLGQQSAPYKNKADLALAKSQEFWAQDWKPSLAKAFENVSMGPLLMNETQALKKVAGSTDATYLEGLKVAEAKQLAVRPSVAEIEKARTELRTSPFSKTALSQLLKLESLNGNRPMVQYLESRLAGLEKAPAAEGVQ